MAARRFMMISYDKIELFCTKDTADTADLFAKEFEQRVRAVGSSIELSATVKDDASLTKDIADKYGSSDDKARIAFVLCSDITCDFRIDRSDRMLCLSAPRKRGLIYAFALVLRKTVFCEEGFELVNDVSGIYKSHKSIRGHQIGYRTTPNTYDAWDVGQYRRYMLETMFSFSDVCEQMPYVHGKSKRNTLMKYDEEELLTELSRICKDLDLDLSLWYPNTPSDDDVSFAIKRREKVFASLPHLKYVFIPGGDPGELDADELIKRCRAYSKVLKRYHPDAEIWPSAQQPHNRPGWGDEFINNVNDDTSSLGGIITGPNRAFPIDELRRRLTPELPIRFYPDITHTHRCEHPLHIDTSPWHYAYAVCHGREPVCPRPNELRALHAQTDPYCVGSVTYSEGVNDDVNKFIWADADFFGYGQTVIQSLEDYSRLFFPGVNEKKITGLILGLEKNWYGSPTAIDDVVSVREGFEILLREHPYLKECWRFRILLMRARTDVYISMRFLFDENLCRGAREHLYRSETDNALRILETPYTSEIVDMRSLIDRDAKDLFEMIGYQTDTRRFYADNSERGAVLDTIDLPVSDKEWLVSKIRLFYELPADADKTAYLHFIADPKYIGAKGVYYSVALNGLPACGVIQDDDHYLDFIGDRPGRNDGSLPTGLFCIYDHYKFKYRRKINSEKDLYLTVTYADDHEYADTTVTLNGQRIDDGKGYGGTVDRRMNELFLQSGFTSVCYLIPKELITDGWIDLTICEQSKGVKLSELKITEGPIKI